MMKKLFLSALAALALVACSDDDPSLTSIIPSSDGDFSSLYTLPAGYESAAVDSAILTITNVASGVQSSYNLANLTSLSVEDGLYNLSLLVYTTRSVGSKEGLKQTLRDVQTNVQIAGGSTTLSFNPQAVAEGKGFLFAEICFNAALAEGIKTDLHSSWFRIVNNSNDTLDASGLCIVESAFTTVKKQDYTPDIMSSAFAVNALYRIPTSTPLPVAPGATLLICDQAYNHQENNASSFDLSKADFEWYDQTEKNLDIDNPEVPNLEQIYKSSQTVWTPSTQANRAYALAFIDTDTATYIRNYTYDYSYEFVFKETVKLMQFSNYMIPNDWIVDLATFSPSTQYEWNVAAQSLDAGYFSMGETGADKNRLGRSARRKMDNGKFIDTNDSANDFELTERGDPYYQFY